jgi:EmrB/QacA subfamily drug resistance transporter
MSAAPALHQESTPRPKESRRRWVALAFIAVAQLMIALDATIVSIALPTAQSALHASDADRQWVVTAYTLAFGGLLLLGGRVADYLGRKHAFLIGLAGFSLASMVGGAAPDFAVLVAARALQGAFAALLAPTALSLLAVTFTEPRERATAFAVYGSIAGSGAAIGMLLGGALTQYLSWRWCLYVNLPVALIAAAGGWAVLAPTLSRSRPSFDLPGALMVTGALASLVYACTNVVASGWSSPSVTGFLVGSAVMLVLFVVRESRTANPLLPLRILADRNRSGAYITVGLGVAGMFGAFLFLTYYLQVVLRYPPLQAGLAFLPITIASQAGSWLIARQLMPRVAPRLFMVPVALVAASGMVLLTQLHVDSGYISLVLPAEILLGLGISSLMVPAFSIATHGVDPREAGVASATVNTAQQVGASLGTALLNTIATSATAGFAGAHAVALVYGFSAATAWGAGILLLAALTSALLITAQPSRG